MPPKDICERRNYQRSYREAHKEELRKKAHESWVATPPERRKERSKRQYAKQVFAQRTRARERRLYLRRLGFTHYGWECLCCGVSIEAFLTFDHINNNGAAYRQANGYRVANRRGKSFPTDKLMRELQKQGWPMNEVQVLCMNCNMARFRLGSCPHGGKTPWPDFYLS